MAEQKRIYICPKCGTPYTSLDNFPAVRGNMYSGWSNHIPYCRECVDGLFFKYVDDYDGDEEKAIYRICQIFNVYYCQQALDASLKRRGKSSRIRGYLHKASTLAQCAGKSFDDTLEEEKSLLTKTFLSSDKSTETDCLNKNDGNISDATKKFWGNGYASTVYSTLQGYYDELLKLCSEKPDVKKQKMMKNLCLLEYQMQINIQAGKDIGTLSNSYKAMFEAAELKSDDADISNDAFGKWIMDIEKYCPAEIYQDKKMYHDFFGIVEYIERFMFRPLKNLVFGTKEKENEYWINDEDINVKGGE